MKLILTLAAAAIAATAALPALANGILPAPAPVPPTIAPVATDWTGGYVGGSIGYINGDSVVCLDGFAPFECDPGPTVADQPSPRPEGGLIGITAGYDWQMGNIVYGIAGDLMFGDVSNAAPTSGGYDCQRGCELQINSVAMLRGRVGYALGDAFLPYVTAGIAATQVSADVFGTATGANDGTFTNAVIGLGADYRMTNQITVGFEYLHLIEGNESVNFGDAGCPPCAITNFSADIARVTLAYRF